MDFEIEFFPVGDASKAGDAIVIRYGQFGRYEIMVIDGGTDASGEAIVEHIRDVYGEGVVVSHVVSTHPDSDHACGLRHVLRELRVANLWLHGLWYHARDAVAYFSDKRWTAEGLAQSIRREYPVIEELISIAQEKRVAIHEPFQGETIGPFTVLSPNRVTYQHLLPQFRKTPDPDVDYLKARNIWIGQPKVPGILAALVERAQSWVREDWDNERLREGAVTAAENESSTVLFGRFGNTNVLLTADAGINALTWAKNYGQQNGIDVRTANLIQIPHHGSRSNVTPSLLNALVGLKLPRNSPETKFGVASVPKDDEKHPRKMVINAFRRRGVAVHKTQGIKFRFHSGTMPARPDERQAEAFGFFDSVEDYD